MQPTKRKTAAYRLFHFRYSMNIPQIFFYGKDYLEKHGYHVSGDGMLDHLRLTEMSVVKQTPAGLAMFHAEGCPISLVNRKDASTIYDDIQEHLRDWERLVDQGVHPSDVPPMEDFRQLEAVAMALYPLAKHYTPEEKHVDPLRDRIMAMNRRRNPLGSDRYLRSKLITDQGELKPYVSIVDRIEREVIGSLKSWQ